MQRKLQLIQNILWVCILIITVLIIARIINIDFLSSHYDWNRLPAKISAILLLVIFLPGTLQRMGISNHFTRFLIMIRRILGLAMYLFMLIHTLFLIEEIPWFSEGNVNSFDELVLSGVIASVLLLPPLLLSNTFSIRLFKKNWKIIQRTTYIAIPLIAIHMWMADQILLAILYLVSAVLILISFIIKASMSKKSLLKTSSVATLVVVVAIAITVGAFLFLFKNPNEQTQKELLVKEKAKIEELENEKQNLNQQLSDAKGTIEKQEKEIGEIIVEQENIKEQEQIKEETLESLSYTDGTYTSRVDYSTDKGKLTEAMSVTLALSDDVVQSVSVTGHVSKKKSQKYVDRFNGEIAGVVVGKKIDELSVHGVGGASDNSTGFRSAVENIKVQASK